MCRFPRAFDARRSAPLRPDPVGGTGRAGRGGRGADRSSWPTTSWRPAGIVYVPVSNYVEGDLRAAHEMLVHPRTVPGLSDGGAHCTMIADFDYPDLPPRLLGSRRARRPAPAGRIGRQATVRRHRRTGRTLRPRACSSPGSVPT